MPIPGPHVHRQLISAYNAAAANLESMRGEMSRIDSQRDALHDDREDALTKLAQHYLPDLTPDSIQKTWAEVRPTMREILLRKQNRVRELNEDLQDHTRIRNGQEQALDELNTRLDQAETRQEEIQQQVEQDLTSRTEFVQLSERAAMAEVALERAEANLDEVSQDAAKKLPAYRECRFFTYLQELGYGTPAYQKRGLTKRMDRWIAKMIDYNKAKQSYDYLTKSPAMMQEIIAEDRLALDAVLDELQKHRDDAAERCGLPAQVRLLKALEDERTSALNELTKTSQACENTQLLLNELENPRCEFYQEAITLFRGMLSRTDSSELRQQARRTPDITDDQIVATLRGIETELQQTDLHEDRQQDRLRRGQAIHEAVGRLIQRFRASGFDRGRCQFSDALDIAGHLDRLTDPGDVDELWFAIRRAQSWGPTAMDRVTNVATHPMTQVLVNAMAHAAAGAMSEHARRAGRRTRRRW